MSILGDSVALLNAALQGAAGEEVTYRRGNQLIEHLVVVPGKSRHDDYGDEQVTITARERDFIALAEQLVMDGNVIEPKKGDSIEWTVGGVKRRFEVLPREGDRCFRHTDQTQLQLRIYTVEKTPNTET